LKNRPATTPHRNRAARRKLEQQRLCHKPRPTAPATAGEVQRLLSGLPKLSEQAGGDDAAPPTQLLVCPWGLTETLDGPILCDADTVRILPERQRTARADQVAIDFDHATAFGKGKGTPRDIAGYGTPKVVPNEGIYLCDIRWTPTGKKYWANYQDISPAFLQQKDTGRVTFLDSVALTPRGMIEGLGLFSAEDPAAPLEPDASDAPPLSKPTSNTITMDPDKIKKFLDSQKVAYPPDATPDDLAKLAEAALEKLTGAEGPMEMSGETGRLLKTLTAKVASLESADATRTQAHEDARKAEIIRQASADGKVLPPDEVIKNMSAAHLQLTADATPATVKGRPGSGLNPAQKGGEKEVTLTAEDRQVASQLGISEEMAKQFHAYGDCPVRA
jgi:phage I-like protein